MPKNKRKSVSEPAAEKKKKSGKAGDAKGMRTGVATLTICAAAFGAYYSPHFRTASSDWLERGRAFLGRTSSTDESSKAFASATDKAAEKLAQAPSFRDFLTDEYGEEGARELLGIEETAPDVSEVSEASVEFADYFVAETNASEASEPQGVAPSFDAPSLPVSQESGSSFADYVAAETNASEASEPQGVAPSFDAPSLPAAPESGSSFADYVAAETNASEASEPQGVASSSDAPSLPAAPESGSSFADYVAAETNAAPETDALALNAEKTRLEQPISEENEAALTTRLQNEMKERGVGNPRIERWGGRFWRASGFATTSEGVATFYEAVDVDPTAAQRAALAKFNAANF